MGERLRVATRASRLARAQTQLVVDALAARGVLCDVIPLSTRGDRMRDRSLASIGGDGVFVKELETALVEGRADIAVHSMKDLPTELLAGTSWGVVLERGDARDVLLAMHGAHASIGALPDGAIVGTSSLRRKAQLLAMRPDLDVRDLRGNVDTRIRKLREGAYHAIVLALAGVQRSAAAEGVPSVEPVPPDDMVPAVGQGALFVQCRTEDALTRRLIAPLNHAPSALAVAMERAFLRRMGGGCLVPIGAHVELTGGSWRLAAFAAMPDGTQPMRRTLHGELGSEAEAIAAVERMADEMLAAGGGEIIAHHRRG
jgi:hydroxymethylbilane synthase